jgi:hypothetical protein
MANSETHPGGGATATTFVNKARRADWGSGARSGVVVSIEGAWGGTTPLGSEGFTFGSNTNQMNFSVFITRVTEAYRNNSRF